MVKMSIALAQKIISDSRYSDDKKKEARRVVKEAKKAGQIEPKTKKTGTRPKTKTGTRTRTKTGTKTKTKTTKTKAGTKSKAKTKTRTAKIKRAKTPRTKARKTRTKKVAKTKTAKSRNSASKSDKIKFYDVANKKYLMIPRSECKVKRNRNPRGGDQLIANHKGRKLFTFVKKGFEL